MDMNDAEKALEEIGLDEKEAKTYLALLKLGEATASRVHKETKIERSLVYYVIEKLVNSGLTGFKIKNGVKYYSPSDPEQILDGLKEKEKLCQKMLPFLKEMRKKPREDGVAVNVYNEIGGLRTVMNDMLSGKAREILVLGEEGQIQTHYPAVYREYMRRLKELKIREKVLVREDLRGKLWQSKMSELRYVPKEIISPTNTLIYGDTVIITLWEKPTFNIVISSKKVADSFRSYFGYFWKSAKK